jgi:Zn-dependent M16 (insulinase) family peptidase
MLTALSAELTALHERIRSAPRRFLLVGEEEHRDSLRQQLEQFWIGQADSRGDFVALSLPETRSAVQQLWLTSTQVSFCAKAYPTVPTGHPDAAALTVLGDYLRNGYLHRAIREKGGAYGAGAGQDNGDAIFRFFSYRDPRIEGTLDDFDQALQWLATSEGDPQRLQEAILGVVSSMDKPGSPAGEAKSTYHSSLFGRTPEVRQAFRQRILSVTLDDLKRVASTWLSPEKASMAVVTSHKAADSLPAEWERIEI